MICHRAVLFNFILLSAVFVEISATNSSTAINSTSTANTSSTSSVDANSTTGAPSTSDTTFTSTPSGASETSDSAAIASTTAGVTGPVVPAGPTVTGTAESTTELLTTTISVMNSAATTTAAVATGPVVPAGPTVTGTAGSTTELLTTTISAIDGAQTSTGQASTTASGITVSGGAGGMATTSDSQDSSTADAATPTATMAATTTSSDSDAVPKTICGHEVSTIGEADRCHPNHHKVIIREIPTDSTTDCDPGLPVDEWIRFADTDDNCLHLPIFADDTCPKPGSYGTFPYHMKGNSTPETDGSYNRELCFSDSLLSGSFSCCQRLIVITQLKCDGGYAVFKLAKQIYQQGCPKLFLSTTDDIPTFTKVVKDGERLPEKFENLGKQEQENLVTIVFIITSLEDYKKIWQQFDYNLTEAISAAVKSEMGRRRRRDTSGNYNTQVIDGYPVIDTDNKKAIYVVLVTDDQGKAVAKKTVEIALDDIKTSNPRVIPSSGVSFDKIDELPEELQQKFTTKVKVYTKPTATAVTEPKGEGSRLWIAIVIIIGVTAGIVAISFIAVWCYGFSQRGRSGNMAVSQTKAGLMGQDELNNTYKPISGHDNLAMEQELCVDPNRNGRRVVNSSVTPMAENAV